MPRSYRNIVLALGLVLACTNHAYAESNHQQGDPHKSIAQSLGDIATAYRQETERSQRPSKETEPCERSEDRRYSDLCAQWKAADAATDSAWWAWAAGISSIISTAAVLIAIGLTYPANSIARDTARRQLRAYLYVEMKKLPSLELGSWPEAEIWLRNGGGTPAHNVRITSAFTIGRLPFDGNPPDLPPQERTTGTIKAPNNSTVIYCRAHEGDITQPRIDAIKSGKNMIVFYGIIHYSDVFGDKHFTRYRANYGGPQCIENQSVFWHETGNDAT